MYNTDTNELLITVDGAGTDTVTCDPVTKKVKFNGADPTRAPAAGGETGCAASVNLKVDETDKTTATANTLDLRGVTRADWTGLAGSATPFSITMGGGNDTVFGTEFADSIAPANGDDTVHANDGADTLIWNPGEVSDVMNGGDGKDTVLDNGGGGDEQFVVKPTAGNDSITGNVGLAGLIKTEMNGGDGNDVLVGTDGDDLLVWNPGEGTDKFEGGAGNDIGQDNGGAAAEHFIVSANGQRVTATRDNGAPFFLDMGTIETLDLNAGGGDDSVEVNNGLGALIKVDANLGDGNDATRARNDSAQIIDGAAGTDTAQVDATDQVTNVETIQGADKTKPKARVLSGKLKLKNGKVKVRVSLPKGGSVSKGKITILRGNKVVGSKKITMGAGTKTFSMELKRSARIALAKAKSKKLAATVKVKLTDAAGNSATVSKQRDLTR